MRIYAPNETDQYAPPPCPRCGGPTDVTWIDVTAGSAPPGSMLVPGTYACARACETAPGHHPVEVASIDRAHARHATGSPLDD